MSATGRGVIIRGGWQLWLGAVVVLTSVLLGLGIGSASATQAVVAGGVATSWSNYEVAVTTYDGSPRVSHQHTATRDGSLTEGVPWALSRLQSVPPGRSHLVSGFVVAAKTAGEAGEGASGLFATSGRGTTFDVPKGWVGRNANNDKGLFFQRPGSVGDQNSVRIMEPTQKYPDGYVRVYNSEGNGQPVDVFGRPGPPSDTHISQLYRGPWPGWPGQ